MKILDIYGRERRVNIKKYYIKWGEKVASNLQWGVKNIVEPFFRNDIVLEEFVIPSSLLRIDILNISKKIAIEVHGEQHEKYNKHFHKTVSGYLSSYRRDGEKRKWIEETMSYKLIEVNFDEVDLFSRQWVIEKYGIDLL